VNHFSLSLGGVLISGPTRGKIRIFLGQRKYIFFCTSRCDLWDLTNNEKKTFLHHGKYIKNEDGNKN
jgi:hypothetical protein